MMKVFQVEENYKMLTKKIRCLVYVLITVIFSPIDWCLLSVCNPIGGCL